jgi:hypothetical protein
MGVTGLALILMGVGLFCLGAYQFIFKPIRHDSTKVHNDLTNFRIAQLGLARPAATAAAVDSEPEVSDAE